jgi:hypothetical protein
VNSDSLNSYRAFQRDSWGCFDQINCTLIHPYLLSKWPYEMYFERFWHPNKKMYNGYNKVQVWMQGAHQLK